MNKYAQKLIAKFIIQFELELKNVLLICIAPYR